MISNFTQTRGVNCFLGREFQRQVYNNVPEGHSSMITVLNGQKLKHFKSWSPGHLGPGTHMFLCIGGSGSGSNMHRAILYSCIHCCLKKAC